MSIKRRNYKRKINRATRLTIFLCVLAICYFAYISISGSNNLSGEADNHFDLQNNEFDLQNSEFDGVPQAYMELYERNPETYDFVIGSIGRDLPEPPDENIVVNEIVHGSVPLYIQWDTKWGYTSYGTETMAIAGCGPTALSMVVSAITLDNKYTPRYMADYSEQNGYISSANATSWSFMTEAAKKFGINARELPLDKNAITNSLNSNELIIVSVREGDFTTGGHFIVLVGIDDNGKIIVNDSNSYIRSEKKWDLSVIMEQTKNLWAFDEIK